MCCRRHYVVHPILILLCVAIVRLQSIPSNKQCGEEESPIFILQHNATATKVQKRIRTNTLLECTDTCAASKECAGVVYENTNCNLLSSIGGNGEISDPILSKICVKSAQICSSPFQFDVHEQKILVGFAREVVSADSLSVCLAACLNAFDTFGFECESVMYYPIDSECILNTEDRLDRPDLFIDELEDNVIYLDNNCAGSQCYAPYVTQYIAMEGKQLANELDLRFNVDLATCESLCTQRLSTTANDFNCKSFMYNPKTNTCILSDERSKPLGRAELVDAEGFTYYEKKCFASPRTCRNTPAFNRVSKMILVGFAAFVMENVPSVTMCLDQCTNPPPETEDFVCKSVMYYYNEQECILNAETRHTKPDLFIPEGDEFQVDYFDITCQLGKETCAEGTSLRLIRTINAALPEGEGSLHVLQSTGNSVGECMAKCYELAPEKCRSFNYHKQTAECDLLYVDGKTTLRPEVRQAVDSYDLHCLAAQPDCSLNKDGAVYSRYLYTKQTGLPTEQYESLALNKCLDLCSKSQRCEGVNYNRRNGHCDLFEQIDGTGDQNDFTDFYKNLCLLKETDSGYSAAANVPRQPGHNTVTNSKADSRAEILGANKVKPTIREHDGSKKVPEPEDEGSKHPFHKHPKAEGTLTLSAKPPPPPVLVPADAVRTICNYEGIKVQVKNKEAFTGVMFVKNKYDTCRVEVTNSDSAILVLGLPHDFGSRIVESETPTTVATTMLTETFKKLGAKNEQKAITELRTKRELGEHPHDCGIVDMLNGTYKSTVVVQTNNLGIPGLVTSMDQIYEVSCDYSSMLGGKVMAGANLSVHGPEATLIQPRGKIELGNPVMMQLLNGDGEHQPLLQAKLGDLLELRWEMVAMDEELDFFVRECFAEPGGNGITKEKLELIEDGCPTPAVAQKLIPTPVQIVSSAVKSTKMQAFRFDSSNTVRLTCHLDICKGMCEEARCSQNRSKTNGRKKRSDNSVLELETERYKVPRHAQATTSLLIIDPLQQINEPIALVRSQNFEFSRETPSVSVSSSSGQLCMEKSTILTVFGILFVLTVIQAIVVSQYVFRRLILRSKIVEE